MKDVFKKELFTCLSHNSFLAMARTSVWPTELLWTSIRVSLKSRMIYKRRKYNNPIWFNWFKAICFKVKGLDIPIYFQQQKCFEISKANII
jgi:hypothetical protein